jgi:hypothetical protein
MGGPRTAGRLVLQKSRYYQEAANAERMRDRLAKREAATLEQQIEGGMIFCGSPESVVKQIRRVHGELGNGVFNFTMKVGNLPDAAVRRGMELSATASFRSQGLVRPLLYLHPAGDVRPTKVLENSSRTSRCSQVSTEQQRLPD